MNGLIFDIKRYSVHDGPGIRTTVFFKGCPLRCAWCHNPESQSSNKQIIYYEDKCILCQTCVHTCKEQAVSVIKNRIKIDTKKCTLCGDCTDNCPTNALEMIGKEYEVKKLVGEILKDKDFFDGGGGITISGGEPFVQYEFLLELLKELKESGVHIAIDTTGHTKTEKLLNTLPFVDLYMYDIKLMDAKKHKQYTGVGNELILKNLIELDKNGVSLNIRIPIIPTINDDDENISETIEFLKGLKNIASVDLLPYHNMMIDKYKRLNMPFFLSHIKKPTDNQMGKIKEKFENHGFKTNIGG